MIYQYLSIIMFLQYCWRAQVTHLSIYDLFLYFYFFVRINLIQIWCISLYDIMSDLADLIFDLMEVMFDIGKFFMWCTDTCSDLFDIRVEQYDPSDHLRHRKYHES